MDVQLDGKIFRKNRTSQRRGVWGFSVILVIVETFGGWTTE